MHICLFAAIFCMTTLTPVLAQAAAPSKGSTAVAAPKAAEPPQKPPTSARTSGKSGTTPKADSPQKPSATAKNSNKPVVPIKTEPPQEQAQAQTPAPRVDSADRLFIRLIAASTSMVADIGELASERATNDNVKTLGAQMLESNLTTQAWIEDLARQQGVPLPNEQQAEQKAVRRRLESLEGLSFDMAYLQVQLIEHQKTLQLLQWEISFGQDVQVQRLAMEMLPTVLNRLQNVQILLTETADLAANTPAATSPAQVAAEDSPQEMVEDDVQESAQQAAEKAPEKAPPKTAGKIAGKVAKRAAEKPAEKVTKEKPDERVEEKAENSAEPDVATTIRRL